MEDNKEYTGEGVLPLFSGDEAEENGTGSAEQETVAVSAAAPDAAEPREPAAAAVPEAAAPENAPAVSSDTSGGIRIPAGLQPSAKYGSFLRQVREANGITLAELSRATRIKQSYLDAVEQENYENLPAVVYALAYIKVMAGYYGVDEAGQEILTSEVRKHLEYEAPEENKTVIGYDPSEENQVLLRRILIAGACGIVFLAVLITLAVLYFTTGSSEAPVTAGPARGAAPAGLEENHLVDLQPSPVLKPHILPVPKR